MFTSVPYPSTSSPSPHNSRKLVRMLSLPLSRSLVDYVVDLSIDVVNHGLGRPPVGRGRSSLRNIFHTKFRHFVDSVIYRAQVTVPMLLTSAVYIARSKPFIQISKPDWAFERVFLGALIVSTKYHNDRSLRNTHWAAATAIFSPRDVSRIEREMLDVLNFELRVEGHELLDLVAILHSAPQVAEVHRPQNADNNALWELLPTSSKTAASAEEQEDTEMTSRWSDSDSDSGESDVPSSSEESCDDSFPFTPSTPLSLFPRPPISTAHAKQCASAAVNNGPSPSSSS